MAQTNEGRFGTERHGLIEDKRPNPFWGKNKALFGYSVSRCMATSDGIRTQAIELGGNFVVNSSNFRPNLEFSWRSGS